MKDAAIDVLVKPLNRFIRSESIAGMVLLGNVIIALVWANTSFASTYHDLWHYEFSLSFAGHTITNTLRHWINDGLMAMFFFVVGLEMKSELLKGELSSPRKAALPLAAAMGGMVFPALIYIAFNPQLPERNGWGIPMATDIAFALGILALLGKRIPPSLKIFLTALAIADDLGAVLVIAFFYTSDISTINLGIGVIFLGILITGNLLGIRNTIFYGIFGIGGLWLAFLMSGVHATIAGVLAAFAIPARSQLNELAFTQKLKNLVHEFEAIPPNNVTLLEPEQVHVIDKIKKLTAVADTPLQRLEYAMHPIVAFLVMPLFALANAGIDFNADFFNTIMNPVSIGIITGLVVGKFAGITGTCFLLVRTKLSPLPTDVTWRHILGTGFLAGIGFTMSLFITNLAFNEAAYDSLAKGGIFFASLLAGLLGFLILRTGRPVNP